MKPSFKVFSVLALAGSLWMVGCGGADASRSVKMGQEQSFTLKNLEGKEISFESVLSSHKAVLINFWATWCPPCREEIPDLIKLQEQYKDKSFTVLGIDVGESAKKVSLVAQKIGINYPVLLDGEQQVSEAYGIVGIPTSYLVSSDGKVIGEYHSASPKLFADVEKAVVS